MSDALHIPDAIDAAPLVLCVDDEEITLRLVGRLLEGMGLRVAATSSPAVAIRLFDSETFDLVITDIRMPGMDGHAFLEAVRARDPQVPIIVATGYATLENAMRALREGATGMLIKPFTAEEFATEVEQALERARFRRDALRYRFVTPILDGVALALSSAIEARHLETGEHCRQLGHLGERLANILGLDERSRTTIRIGGFLHDVGKIGISDAVLLKPGRLTEAEFADMRRHPEIGAAMVATQEGMASIAAIVRHHHERWDGAGYPDRLKGEEIPIGARIISVVDAFSAMTTDRVYRMALEPEAAWAELRRNAGSQFDPGVVALFEVAVDLSPELVAPRLAAACPGRHASDGSAAEDSAADDAFHRSEAQCEADGVRSAEPASDGAGHHAGDGGRRPGADRDTRKRDCRSRDERFARAVATGEHAPAWPSSGQRRGTRPAASCTPPSCTPAPRAPGSRLAGERLSASTRPPA